MAEIHVEPKKHTSNSSWLWIVLALLIAAAVVYYLVTRNDDSNNTTVPAANATGAISLPQAVTGNTLAWC
jgi:bacteriorhodopsin